MSTWGHWLKHYPQAVAYQMFDKYRAVEPRAQPAAGSLKSRGPVDKRLPADTMVLGVWDGKDARAYLLRTKLRSWLNLEDDRAVLWYGPTQTAAAYRLVASPPAKATGKPRRVTLEMFDRSTTGPGWRDRETGSEWDIAGRAVGGKLKGWTLEWLDGTQVKWFAWAAEYPQTTIHGK